MNWFRFYGDALYDPKVQRLSPILFKHWVNILCLASKQDERGSLPPVDDIGFALRTDDAQRIVDELIARKLIDKTDSGIRIHGWDDRQKASDSSTERVQRYRENRKVDVDSGGNVADETHVTLHSRSGNVLDKSREDKSREDTDKNGKDAPDGAHPPRKRKRQIPDDFELTEKSYDWAIEKGLDRDRVDLETEAFRNHAAANGVVHIDWHAAWRTWMIKAATNFGRRAPIPINGEATNGSPPARPTPEWFMAEAERLRHEEQLAERIAQ